MSEQFARPRPTRRHVVQGVLASSVAAAATRVLAAAPPTEVITPALIEAARKEAAVHWYTAMDLPAAEALGKAFEAKFPGIAVRVERSGSERVFSRIAQELSSRINNVDVVTTADASHAIVWKRDGLLAAYVPEDVARFYKPEHKDADGTFAIHRAHLSVIAYNKDLVKAEDAPKSYADLLEPKWLAKLVKGNPNYSGTILTATFQIARDLGWAYYEKLAKQKVLQVQSSVDPPKKIALGERPVMADGGDYNVWQQQQKGAPLEIVYASEGTPFVTNPNAVFKSAPHPNAARLLQNWMLSAEGQQFSVDITGIYSLHSEVKAKPGRRPLADIKLMKDDAQAVEAQSDQIKARYTQIFRV